VSRANIHLRFFINLDLHNILASWFG
jgi:hypothetical protein